MAFQIINVGTSPNDGTGDSARFSFQKINSNFGVAQTSLDTLTTSVAGKVTSVSPALSGVPTAPTATAGTNTTQIATTAFVTGALGSYLTTSAAALNYAPLASPALTGNPTAPTQLNSDNSTRLANTAWVRAYFASISFTMPAGAHIGGFYTEYLLNTALTTQIPWDDTIPQVSEGTEILTINYAMQNAANTLRVRVSGEVAAVASTWVIIAAFIDGAANAVKATGTFCEAAGAGRQFYLEFQYTPGDTTSHTYSVRVGPDVATTVRLNGASAASGRKLGGAMAAVMIANEIKG